MINLKNKNKSGKTSPYFIYFTSLFAIIFPLLSCTSNKSIIKSMDQRQEIKIDGDLSEWSKIGQYIKKGDLSLEVLNSTTTLFLSVRIINAEAATEILKSGFSIWLDNTGKQNKSGIQIPPVNESLLSSFYEIGKMKKENPNFLYNPISRDSLFKSIQSINIVENGKVTQTIPLTNRFGVDIGIASESYTGGITYEIAVPFESSAPDYPLDFTTSPGGTIYIGLENPQAINNNQLNNSPVSFQFGLGMGSVGMGRYGRYYDPYYYGNQKSKTTWLEVKLVRAY